MYAYVVYHEGTTDCFLKLSADFVMLFNAGLFDFV